MDGKSRIVVVDRISEGVATLVPDGEDAHFFATLADLPPGVREGDCLHQEFAAEGASIFRPAPDETERRRQRVRGKLDRLRKQ